ncbi:MAG: GatB/YqeY domain-containing protein [Alphaproteobacteria bacterium]|nr:GatB/YqeY domain-containing protein [Alphaproteobacteria bacterium]
MLRQELNEALKGAMKAREARTISTIRLILAALKDRDIAVRSSGNMEGLSDPDILELLKTMIRQRRESILTFEAGGRVDLAQQEAEEIVIIERFLPEQLGQAQMEAAIKEAVAELGAKTIKDMGKTIQALKAKYAGQMDFSKASAILKQLLTGA